MRINSPSSPRPFSWQLMVCRARLAPRLAHKARSSTHTVGPGCFEALMVAGLLSWQPVLLGCLRLNVEAGEVWERGRAGGGEFPALQSSCTLLRSGFPAKGRCGLTFQASLTHGGALEGPEAAGSCPGNAATCTPARGGVRIIPGFFPSILSHWLGQAPGKF